MNMDKILKDLYKTMLLIRRAEEKIAELYSEQEMRCPTHLCIGQEAVAAGVCLNLLQKDSVFSNHRDHGHYLAKGGNINKMFAEMYGKATGCSKGRGGSMHLVDLPSNFVASTPYVGGTIPVAVGSAFADKANHKDGISVTFFGDAAVEEGVFHESLNFAQLRKLPVLFVCENNLYACQTHISERQPDREIIELAKGHGVKCYKADGNDALKVYEVIKEAIEYLKSGQGPVFTEFSTYRWLEHCGPNDDKDIGYRSEKEINEWKDKDPIKRMRNVLLSKNLTTEKALLDVDLEIKQKVADAVKYAKDSPYPEKESLHDYLYAK